MRGILEYTMKQDSVFIRTFGRSPMTRLLDFLMENNVFDYPKSGIAESTGISRVTLDKLLPELLRSKIIKITRQIGRATMYQFDRGSPTGKALLNLDFTITARANDSYLSKAKVKQPIPA